MLPGYLSVYSSGVLTKKCEELFSRLTACSICPRRCGVNRLNDEQGFCKTGLKPVVFSFLAHRGEEPPLSGMRGSGTIFFSGCNMACVYCQNYEFSQLRQGGREVDAVELAGYMLKLQEQGCHNINLVTPTHVLPQILKSLIIAIPRGLRLPLVYNTGGYELPEIIAYLNGIVDIYLPDMRYGNSEMAAKYSSASDYSTYNQTSVKAMYHQVREAVFDKEGMIERGLIIRHLVLPQNISGTEKIMEFIAIQLSTDIHISLMSQYIPYYQASRYPELSRRISAKEYQVAQDILKHFGLHNGWVQQDYGIESFAGVHLKPMNIREGRQ